MDRIVRSRIGDTATVLNFDENRLVVRWDDFGVETFIKTAKTAAIKNEKTTH